MSDREELAWLPAWRMRQLIGARELRAARAFEAACSPRERPPLS